MCFDKEWHGTHSIMLMDGWRSRRDGAERLESVGKSNRRNKKRGKFPRVLFTAKSPTCCEINGAQGEIPFSGG